MGRGKVACRLGIIALAVAAQQCTRMVTRMSPRAAREDVTRSPTQEEATCGGGRRG